MECLSIWKCQSHVMRVFMEYYGECQSLPECWRIVIRV